MPLIDHATTPNGRLAEDFLAAMGRMDIGAISEYLEDDATWWMPGDLPVSGYYEGKLDIVGGFLASASALFEPGSLAFEIRGIRSDADCVIVEYMGTGRSASEGRPYRNTYCTIFEFRDARISSVREYLDTAHVRDVLYPAMDK